VQGLKIRFDLVPLKEGRRVAWSVTAPEWSHKGIAGTVFEAIDEIGGHYTRQSFTRKPASVQDSLF
jgi:hypothetical protein